MFIMHYFHNKKYLTIRLKYTIKLKVYTVANISKSNS